MSERLSVTGRIANAASNRLGRAAFWQGRIHRWLYERSGGRRWGRWLGKPVFVLTVEGRRTGQPRSVVLMLIRRGDDIVVCGSNAGNEVTPNWYRNLVAAGRATVHVGSDRWAVTAREVEGAERDECWTILCEAYPDFVTYQALTSRRLPIAVLERSPS